MRFGPQTNLVEEVIEYAARGDLFIGPYRGDACAIFVERDFPKALELARTQNPQDGYAIWTDLNEIVMSKVYGQQDDLDDLVNEELFRLGDELGAIFRKRLGRGPYAEIVDEVASDFYHCAYKRAILGGSPHFSERLYECYRDGGWPCGWKGEYPAGLLVVYSPG